MGLLSRTTFWRAHVLASDVGGGAGGGYARKKRARVGSLILATLTSMAGAAKPIGARQFFSLARAAVPFRRLAAANQRRRFCGQVRSSGRTKRTGCEFPLSTVFSFVFPSESNSKLARNSDLVKAAPSFTGPFFYYCRNLSRSVNWNVFSLSFF